MTTQSTLSTDWDQEAFENADRRRSRQKLAAGAEKQNDLLHLDVAPPNSEHVHAVLQEHTRHTDSLHTHGDAVFVSCAPGDAEGLRAKLEPHFQAKNLAVPMGHNTFAASSELAVNLGTLKPR
jgi:hypothetical protein